MVVSEEMAQETRTRMGTDNNRASSPTRRLLSAASPSPTVRRTAARPGSILSDTSRSGLRTAAAPSPAAVRCPGSSSGPALRRSVSATDAVWSPAAAPALRGCCSPARPVLSAAPTRSLRLGPAPATTIPTTAAAVRRSARVWPTPATAAAALRTTALWPTPAPAVSSLWAAVPSDPAVPRLRPPANHRLERRRRRQRAEIGHEGLRHG